MSKNDELRRKAREMWTCSWEYEDPVDCASKMYIRKQGTACLAAEAFVKREYHARRAFEEWGDEGRVRVQDYRGRTVLVDVELRPGSGLECTSRLVSEAKYPTLSRGQVPLCADETATPPSA